MPEKTVLVVTWGLFHNRLFERLEDSLSPDCRFIYITNLYSIARRIRKRSGTVYRVSPVRIGEAVPEDVAQATEVISQRLTRKAGEALWRGARKAAEKALEKDGTDLILFWNGSAVKDRAVGALAREKGIPTLYFEIANLPGKLFADPKGVNAASALASDLSLLEKTPGDKEAFSAWRETYLASKKKGHKVSQAALSFNINKGYFADWLGSLFLGFAKDTSLSVLTKIKKKLSSRKAEFQYDHMSPEGVADFLFFPMQVSSDTQVLLNSDVGLIEAIRKAKSLADEKGLELMVKPHPAEPDTGFVNRIQGLREEIGFSFVGGNTFDWIFASGAVVTINSTVGLEALIAGKEVITLGRSFYREFNGDSLATYITGYLYDVDFFSDGSIEKELAEKILQRALILE